MTHRVSSKAAADLDDIMFYVATESGSIEIAERLIASITARFSLLASRPYLGRSRDADFGSGSRSLPVRDYVIVYTVEDGNALILRVVHGRRDLEALFGG
jgi:toxin ParE1/3/4